MPTTAVDFRLTAIADIEEHGSALLEQHYAELTLNKQRDKLSPDWDRYYELERAEALLVIGAYSDDQLVGYSITIVQPHLHYTGTTQAINDVLFLASEFRGGRAGVELIRLTERMAEAMGANAMGWHAKQGTALDALLPRLGYGVQDIWYTRTLQPGEAS